MAVGKVGLAALQDIAARQEAALALDDVTPTNQDSREADARYDPDMRKMVQAGGSGHGDDERYVCTCVLGVAICLHSFL